MNSFVYEVALYQLLHLHLKISSGKELKGRRGGAVWVSFTVLILSYLIPSDASYSSSFSACIKEPSLIYHIKKKHQKGPTNHPASPDRVSDSFSNFS
jgi:hypothetical protein